MHIIRVKDSCLNSNRFTSLLPSKRLPSQLQEDGGYKLNVGVLFCIVSICQQEKMKTRQRGSSRHYFDTNSLIFEAGIGILKFAPRQGIFGEEKNKQEAGKLNGGSSVATRIVSFF